MNWSTSILNIHKRLRKKKPHLFISNSDKSAMLFQELAVVADIIKKKFELGERKSLFNFFS